jgi:hypothetical protein
MTLLVALLAFVAGAALGAALAYWLLNRRPLAQPSLDATPIPQSDADPDLKPVLDATRGVLSELEERYRGARAEEPRPRRRPGKPRA